MVLQCSRSTATTLTCILLYLYLQFIYRFRLNQIDDFRKQRVSPKYYLLLSFASGGLDRCLVSAFNQTKAIINHRHYHGYTFHMDQYTHIYFLWASNINVQSNQPDWWFFLIRRSKARQGHNKIEFHFISYLSLHNGQMWPRKCCLFVEIFLDSPLPFPIPQYDNSDISLYCTVHDEANAQQRDSKISAGGHFAWKFPDTNSHRYVADS